MLVPLNDRIIIRRDEADEKSRGGIIIPDKAKERPRRGKVLSVGDGKLNDDGTRTPVCVKEGDVVLYQAYSGNDCTFEGEELLIIGSGDVLAVIR